MRDVDPGWEGERFSKELVARGAICVRHDIKSDYLFFKLGSSNFNVFDGTTAVKKEKNKNYRSIIIEHMTELYHQLSP